MTTHGFVPGQAVPSSGRPALSRPTRRTLISLPVALAVAALLLAAQVGEVMAQTGAPVAVAAAKVTRLQGEVRLSPPGGGAGRSLSAGEPVAEGDRLVTGPKARAELTFSDGSVVTLAEDTEFAVVRFDTTASKARFEMVRGAFRSVTGGMARAASPDFEVKTPLATIGIRGTDFWGGFFRSEELGVFMVSGKGVYVMNKAGRQEITRPGQGITVRSPDAAPEPPVKWREAKVKRAVRSVEFD